MRLHDHGLHDHKIILSGIVNWSDSGSYKVVVVSSSLTPSTTIPARLHRRTQVFEAWEHGAVPWLGTICWVNSTVECLPYMQEVVGSNPTLSTIHSSSLTEEQRTSKPLGESSNLSLSTIWGRSLCRVKLPPCTRKYPVRCRVPPPYGDISVAGNTLPCDGSMERSKLSCHTILV